MGSSVVFDSTGITPTIVTVVSCVIIGEDTLGPWVEVSIVRNKLFLDVSGI